MTINACPSRERLSAFYDGIVENTLAEEFHAHIANCTTCQSELDRICCHDSYLPSIRGGLLDGEFDGEPELQRALRGLRNLNLRDILAIANVNRSPSSSDQATLDDCRSSERDQSSAGVTIAGYTILGEIGRGGMGLVVSAQDLTLEREVAIKTVLSRKYAANVRERFIRESKIAAKLAHPGIPPVHTLGKLADGSPYLVMKLIRGQTLATLLSRRASPHDDLTNFLQIFQQVAQAVAFAHTNGIIHRDLKPANIMVGEFGEVQVMDWGLAKILRDVGTNRDEAGDELLTRSSSGRELKAGETRSGTIMGSPSFMAPEQARGEAVDTPADVFSLGAILYAILVGEGPFDHAKSSSAIIQTSAAGDLTTAFRKLDASKIDSDLIELAKGCLNANPTTRIQNAGEVANAIADYRSAVEMRLQQAQTERAAAATRVAEQKKRRRLVALATAALLVVLVGGIVVSSNQAFRAIQAEKATSEQLTKTNLAKRDAEHARDVAKNRYQVAMNAFNDMIFTIQNKLATRPNTLELRKELLAGARIGLKQLLTETEDQNEPDQKLAWSHIQMGIIEKLFGNNDEAQREFEEAHKLAVRMVKSNPDRLAAQHDLSAALAHLGDEALRRNESLQALEFYKQKIEIDRRITERDSNNLVHQRDLSLSLGRMGQVALQHGQVTEAYDYYQQKLENSKRIAASDPANAMFQRDLANSHELLGNAAGYLNKPEQVLENYRSMNEIMQRLLDADTSNVQRQRDVSISLVKLGNYCEDTSKFDAALDYYERAANILKRMADADPQNAIVQCELFVAYDNLGSLELARSKFTSASQWLSKARGVLLPLHEKQLLVGQFQNALADVEQKIAQVLGHINAEPGD